ncbi:MAG: hypothetical protein RIS49_811, partial [Actinomycetota bacterium]
VGFPGETEEDFQGTMDIASQARFAAAYTYKYSIRPGTPAGAMENQVPEDIVGERYTRLHEHQQKISLSVNQESIGSTHRVMVSEIEGRRDEAQSRLTGRSEDFRLSAHYLIGTATNVLKTRGGDAHQLRTAPAAVKSSATSLGIPTVRTV